MALELFLNRVKVVFNGVWICFMVYLYDFTCCFGG